MKIVTLSADEHLIEARMLLYPFDETAPLKQGAAEKLVQRA